MPLTIRLRQTSQVPLEVEGILPETVRGKSLADVEQLTVFHGNRQLPLAEFFEVSGDTADSELRWEGDLSGVHWIGAKMASGRIHIAGDAGRHVGSEMRTGEIVVEGRVSDWLGGELHGGRIHVRGNAGHLVGAAYRGSARGMTGGTILIGGNAGNEIGHTMRRGLIAIGGNVGDLVGFNMLAGSILIFGDSGIRHGAGMRRGTIGFLGSTRPPLLPSFRRACTLRPAVMELLLRELMRQGFAVPAALDHAAVELYNGDLIEGGRGEIWLRAGN